MERVISLLIGYALGNLLMAALVVRIVGHADVFSVGSGNPGMANVMTEYGFVPGILVLIGDLGKTLAACLLCGLILFPGVRLWAVAWASLGCVIGHNYPVWHRFRGGKGVACTCMGIFLIHPLWGLLSMIIGMLAVFFTKYLAVGGVLIPLVFAIISVFRFGPEVTSVSAVLAFLMFLRNRKGLKKVLQGSEKRVDVIGAIRKKIEK